MCFATGSQHLWRRGSQPKHVSNPDSVMLKLNPHAIDDCLLPGPVKGLYYAPPRGAVVQGLIVCAPGSGGGLGPGLDSHPSKLHWYNTKAGEGGIFARLGLELSRGNTVDWKYRDTVVATAPAPATTATPLATAATPLAATATRMATHTATRTGVADSDADVDGLLAEAMQATTILDPVLPAVRIRPL